MPLNPGTTFSMVGKEIFNDLKGYGQSFSDAVLPISKKLARDILKYEKSITQIALERLRGGIKTRDADMAIKNYRQATESAMEDIKDLSVWEAHDTFWIMVSDVMSIVGKLVPFLF